MAQINGNAGALAGFSASMAPVINTYVPPEVPRVDQCTVCGGIIPGRKKHARKSYEHTDHDGERLCKHCAIFFGLGGWTGMGSVTTCLPDEARERLAKIAETGWAMILKTATFAAPNGAALTVEMGDCMKVQTAGNLGLQPNEICSHELTRRLFTVRVLLGEHEVVQFPHEVSAITWLSIMELRQAGELDEQYVGPDDQVGYFGPSQEMRQLIRAYFGG